MDSGTGIMTRRNTISGKVWDQMGKILQNKKQKKSKGVNSKSYQVKLKAWSHLKFKGDHHSSWKLLDISLEYQFKVLPKVHLEFTLYCIYKISFFCWWNMQFPSHTFITFPEDNSKPVIARTLEWTYSQEHGKLYAPVPIPVNYLSLKMHSSSRVNRFYSKVTQRINSRKHGAVMGNFSSMYHLILCKLVAHLKKVCRTIIEKWAARGSQWIANNVLLYERRAVHSATESSLHL